MAVAGSGNVTLRDVVGKTQSEATSALQDAGFKLGEVTSQDDATADPGTVVKQQPAAGAEAEEGTAVDLTVAGAGLVEVPDLTGLSSTEAETQLASAGLTGRYVPQFDAAAPADTVVAHLPQAGSQAPPESTVGVLVSLGQAPHEVAVPDVVGLTQEQAATAIAGSGLVVTTLESSDDQVPEGVIAAQDPAGGKRVAPLSEVLILMPLGTGTTGMQVPKVLGQTEAEATQTLTAAGLQTLVVRDYSDTVAKGVVAAQLPAAGTQVADGSEVDVLSSEARVLQGRHRSRRPRRRRPRP